MRMYRYYIKDVFVWSSFPIWYFTFLMHYFPLRKYKIQYAKKKSVIVLLINIRNAIDIFLKERKNGMNILRAEIIEKAVLIIFQSFICLGEWIISTIVTFSIILLIMRYKCFYRFLWYLFDFVSISIDEKNFQTF